MSSQLLLASRLLLSLMFITSGWGKLVDPTAAAGMISSAGIPGATALAYLTGTFEVATSICLILGMWTKATAALLAAFTVFTAMVFHSSPIDIKGFPPEANALLSAFNHLMMMKNISITGGFLALVALGAGAYSLDARLAVTRPAMRVRVR
ncbi:DoxX family protein [Rhizobium sp. Leaf383]|uniref:DoxX family protein n=1 Tax=Rhizobium sp. Leaf383 TaxID=1736357 RepID=UPI0007159854|nr:DoxX family protein [Rhizobium sp. Leaf383]KQS76681.1 hypothetical protein ASG58_11380 [Rhizobium sp. Leaf383]